MKKTIFSLLLIAFVLFHAHAFAEFPISQGGPWDFEAAPRAAYNSQNHEFLVVWNVFNFVYLPPDPNFWGPVRGQRITASGTLIGTPLDIIYAGVLSDVAYNVDRNEYLVVAEQWLNTVGQRLDASGNKIGGQVTLISPARFPRVLYNSLLHNYLVTGVGTSPNTYGNCDIYTLQVDAFGSPIAPPTNMTTESDDHGIVCDPGIYSLAYAPLEAPDPGTGWNPTPGGRYLLVEDGKSTGMMLNSQGKPFPTVYDFDHGQWATYPYWIPTPATNQGASSNTDVAFGYDVASPSFFLAWSDLGNHSGWGCLAPGSMWSGIMKNLIDASRTLYSTHYVNTNEGSPISWISTHLISPADWNPKVAYNDAAQKFVVAWRETPNPNDPLNDTTVNHIRADIWSGAFCKPESNIVLSSTTGTEDPKFPFVTSSTTSSTVLVGWEDHRYLGGRIFGSLLDLPAPPKYSATIWAWNVLGWIAEPITKDGVPTGFSTPHTFTGLTGTHTFTVPNTDIFGYAFSSWDTGETTTTITVNSDGTHTARYGQISSGLCKVQGGTFATVQSAYNAAANGDTIQCQWALFDEDLAVNRSIAVTLAGGYDLGFTSNVGETTLKGMITVTMGKITISNFSLK